jgi:hypothetical protein
MAKEMKRPTLSQGANHFIGLEAMLVNHFLN